MTTATTRAIVSIEHLKLIMEMLEGAILMGIIIINNSGPTYHLSHSLLQCDYLPNGSIKRNYNRAESIKPPPPRVWSVKLILGDSYLSEYHVLATINSPTFVQWNSHTMKCYNYKRKELISE